MIGGAFNYMGDKERGPSIIPGYAEGEDAHASSPS